jgi:hypothetical protein
VAPTRVRKGGTRQGDEKARVNVVLSKYVRQDKGWNIKEAIITTIDDLNKIIADNKEPATLKEALNICQTEWRAILGRSEESLLFYQNG